MRIGRAVVLASLVAASLARPAAAWQVAVRATTQDSIRAIHLLERAAYGATAADLDEILRIGRTTWLDRQLDPERITEPALDAKLRAFPSATSSMVDLFRLASEARAIQAQQRAAANDSMRSAAAPRRALLDMTPERRELLAAANPQRQLNDLVGAKLVRAVHAERQLEEVMTDFWFNHFNVFFGKGIDRYMVADYERTAIRPHVFGTFEAMLVATATHPAMLFYLDNASSVVPDSMNPTLQRERLELQRLLQEIRLMSASERRRMVQSGRMTQQQLQRLERAERQMQQQRGRQRGLNENYARELMELHTLGVDGGYTQDDVVAVARVFTGWTFRRPGEAARPAAQRIALPGRAGRAGRGARAPEPVDEPTFEFNSAQHDRGEKTVLGRTLPAGGGFAEGLEVLHTLSTHPSTARHIAGKLVEYFVTDSPAPDLVDEVAAVFTRTGGDLRAVTRALFTSERFYDPRHIDAKVKTPFQLIASALRMTAADVGASRALPQALRLMGHLPYNEPTPTGYPATSEDWINSGAMLNRMNFALQLASGGVDGVRIEPARLVPSAGARLPAIVGRAGAAGRSGRGMDAAVNDRRGRGAAAGRRGAARTAAEPVIDAGWLEAWVDGLTERLLPGADAARLRANLLADLAERQAAGDDARVLAARALGLVLGSPDFQKR